MWYVVTYIGNDEAWDSWEFATFEEAWEYKQELIERYSDASGNVGFRIDVVSARVFHDRFKPAPHIVGTTKKISQVGVVQ